MKKLNDTDLVIWYAHLGKTTRSQVCASGVTTIADVRKMIDRGNVISLIDATDGKTPVTL